MVSCMSHDPNHLFSQFTRVRFSSSVRPSSAPSIHHFSSIMRRTFVAPSFLLLSFSLFAFLRSSHAFVSLIPTSNWKQQQSCPHSTSVIGWPQVDRTPKSSSSSSSSTSTSWSTRLFATLPDVSSMRVGEIRDELESYGISTKSFLEKKELVAALEDARAQGKQPIPNKANSASSESTTPRSESQSQSSSGSSPSKLSRDERIQDEVAKATKMSVNALRKELKERGISTTSFFEKSEFVKAYAEAIVDGIGVNGNRAAASEPPRDPSYRDVIMQKMSRTDPRLLQGTVIDISLAR